MGEKINEMNSGGGAIVGFQAPLGIKARKDKLDRVREMNEDISHGSLLVFFKNLDEAKTEKTCKDLDEENYSAVADDVREAVIREAIRSKIKEVVRKKKGGGGFTLYAPNRGKKHAPKAVATFPTKLAAKRAELARFPPKDPKKLARLRKEINKLMKDPKKRAEVERRAQRQIGHDDMSAKMAHGWKPRARARTAMESVALARQGLMENRMLSKIITGRLHERVLNEGLFHEENGSAWDSKLKQMTDDDPLLQQHKKNIKKAAWTDLMRIFLKISKDLRAQGIKVRPEGIKRSDSGISYLPIFAETNDGDVGPFHIYIDDNGRPKTEKSKEAKAKMTSISPETSKILDAQLGMVREDVLGETETMKAISGRDQDLDQIQDRVMQLLGNMSQVEKSVLKQALVQDRKLRRRNM